MLVVNAYANLIILNVIHCFNIICLCVCSEHYGHSQQCLEAEEAFAEISPG